MKFARKLEALRLYYFVVSGWRFPSELDQGFDVAPATTAWSSGDSQRTGGLGKGVERATPKTAGLRINRAGACKQCSKKQVDM